MRFKITEKVDSHRINQKYRVLIVEFEPSDKNFRPRPLKQAVLADWIPTDEEALAIVKQMVKLSPTFLFKVKSMIKEETKDAIDKILKEEEKWLKKNGV